MLKRVGKIALLVVLVILYFNIGYVLHYYYTENIVCHDFKTASATAKLLGGHCLFFAISPCADPTDQEKQNSEATGWLLFFLVWPAPILISLVSWAFHIVYWTLKFFFLGGLVRLLFGIP